MKAKGYLKEYEIKGEKFCFLDGVSMILDRQKFYRDRLNGEKIWNTSKPFGFHFVDDNNQKICNCGIIGDIDYLYIYKSAMIQKKYTSIRLNVINQWLHILGDVIVFLIDSS